MIKEYNKKENVSWLVIHAQVCVISTLKCKQDFYIRGKKRKMQFCNLLTVLITLERLNHWKYDDFINLQPRNEFHC